jgi:hypothetical protein
MLIGCQDCSSSSSLCQVKVLFAYIPVAKSPDETGSYCPGLYNGTDGAWTTQCSDLSDMITWLLAQVTNFANDTLYPWNTCTSAEFASVSATTPTITGPGSLSGCGGDAEAGSFYGTNLVAAQDGSSFPTVCASAQIVAFRMQGNLFIVPEGVTGVSEACLAVSGGGGAARCSSGGALASGTYYIPLPPFPDLCTEAYGSGSISDESIAVQYFPEATEGQPCASILDTFSGDYTTCQSPDPFFGSDPP